MNDQYLRIETTTGKYLYKPEEWDTWEVGSNFLVILKPAVNGYSKKDMFNLQYIISVQQFNDIRANN